MEDLGGLDPRDSDWNAVDELPASLGGIPQEIGRVYVPALLAGTGCEALTT